MPAEKTPGYKLALGRSLACQTMPYFRSAIFSMVVKEMPGLKTMGVTKDGVMYYDPEAISRWTTEEVAAVILHEVSHLLRDHSDRADIMGIPVTDRVGRMGWNIACFPPDEVLPCGQTIQEPRHNITKVSEYCGDLVVVSHQAGSFRATPEHPIYTVKKIRFDYWWERRSEPSWVNADQLTDDHYVLVPKLDEKKVINLDFTSYVDYLGVETFDKRELEDIPLNEDIAWVIGLWVAKGRESFNARFSLDESDTDVASKVQRILHSVGIKSSFCVYNKELDLETGSAVLGRWLEDNCGDGVESRHIPECVMYNTRNIKEAFLRGYTDVVGFSLKRAGNGNNWVTVTTLSKFLHNDLVYLVSSLGYGCHYSLCEPSLKQVEGLWADSLLSLHKLTWSTNVTGRNKRYFVSDEGMWYPIRSVTRQPYIGLVYNLVNTHNHTYVLNSVLVHNCDAEINDDLEDAGVKLPGEAILPKTLGMERGLAAEQYYQNARKLAEESSEQVKQLLKDAMSGWEITEDGKLRNPETGEEVDPNAAGDSEGKKPGEKGSQCGGVAGNPMPHENPDGTDSEGDGKSEAQINAVRKQVAKAVQDEVAKGRGTVPAGLSRWADTQLAPPKVDWRRKLSQYIRTACAFRPGAVDFKYDRPSRRQSAFGYRNAPVLPALRRPVPRVSVAIDTSGSMGPGELETAIQETDGILKAVGAEVSMYMCDAETAGRVHVRDVKDLKEHLLGGGGTCFTPVFDAIKKDKPRPEILIFITDGCGTCPVNPPVGYQVIWLLIGKHRRKPCQWGTFIEIDDDELARV